MREAPRALTFNMAHTTPTHSWAPHVLWMISSRDPACHTLRITGAIQGAHTLDIQHGTAARNRVRRSSVDSRSPNRSNKIWHLRARALHPPLSMLLPGLPLNDFSSKCLHQMPLPNASTTPPPFAAIICRHKCLHQIHQRLNHLPRPNPPSAPPPFASTICRL
jgi:hypothetical protein